MHYILASASPRRKELLEQVGFTFDVIPSDIEEKITLTVPSDIVMELASQKAMHVYQSVESNCPDEALTVIGADTVVVYKDEILGKPADAAEAYDMLSMLADRTHQVYTGVALISRRAGQTADPQVRTFYESTDVTLCPISREDLHAYVSTGDPLDKAGAYGIQGAFAIHVQSIRGDYNNVVGLPIARLYHELNVHLHTTPGLAY